MPQDVSAACAAVTVKSAIKAGHGTAPGRSRCTCLACVNAALPGLCSQVFLRDNIRSNDVLVVSVGGNDIALAPTPCTIANMLALISCTTTSCIEACSCGCALPCDDCCAGCGPGCLSCCLAWPPGLGYFINLFGSRVQCYIERLLSGRERPRAVLVCMIYYPSKKAPGSSWADFALASLGYNNNPGRLQALIRQVMLVLGTNCLCALGLNADASLGAFAFMSKCRRVYHRQSFEPLLFWL